MMININNSNNQNVAQSPSFLRDNQYLIQNLLVCLYFHTAFYMNNYKFSKRFTTMMAMIIIVILLIIIIIIIIISVMYLQLLAKIFVLTAFCTCT
jgi:hypothetical protein